MEMEVPKRYQIQTRDRPGEGTYTEFPGGTTETFESLIDAVKREVREETGLEVMEVKGRCDGLRRLCLTLAGEGVYSGVT